MKRAVPVLLLTALVANACGQLEAFEAAAPVYAPFEAPAKVTPSGAMQQQLLQQGREVVVVTGDSLAPVHLARVAGQGLKVVGQEHGRYILTPARGSVVRDLEVETIMAIPQVMRAEIVTPVMTDGGLKEKCRKVVERIAEEVRDALGRVRIKWSIVWHWECSYDSDEDKKDK